MEVTYKLHTSLRRITIRIRPNTLDPDRPYKALPKNFMETLVDRKALGTTKDEVSFATTFQLKPSDTIENIQQLLGDVRTHLRLRIDQLAIDGDDGYGPATVEPPAVLDAAE
jgi:hypothetical protein